MSHPVFSVPRLPARSWLLPLGLTVALLLTACHDPRDRSSFPGESSTTMGSAPARVFDR